MIKPGVVGLSPLAGVSDRPFRTICTAYGCDFAVTEMVSAKALSYGDARSLRMLSADPTETTLICQLFGSEPAAFRSALLEQINPRTEFVGIDLNMGCPAPKIVKNGEGSALMKDPMQAAQIFRTLVRYANKPVSVKFRLGFTEDTKNFLEIGRIAQEEGVQSVTLHARTAEQQYSGQADWTAIRALRETLSIPVIGNGDVRTPEDALHMLEETGCAGVAIGRGAMGNPFLFRQIRQLRTQGHYAAPCLSEREAMLLRLYEMEVAWKGARVALLEMRKHIAWTLAGLPGASRIKREINQMTSIEEVKATLHAYFQTLGAENER